LRGDLFGKYGGGAAKSRERLDGRYHRHTDFIDPIDHVAEVARHPPKKIIVLTDLHDQRVSASVQTAYVEALRRVGVAVDHRFLPASGKLRHDLQLPGILAAFTWLANDRQT